MDSAADPRTEVYYSSLAYHYLNAIFDPTENEDSLSETALSFAAPEAAAKQLDMSAYGVSLTDMRYRSLTAQALQTLWDERSAAGTLRENRWGDGSSPIKNHSTVAAQERWTEEDACYYLTARQGCRGVPLEGRELSAYVGREGLLYLQDSLVQVTEGELLSLAPAAALCNTLNETASNIYSEKGCALTALELCCFPQNGSCIPAWRAVFAYTYTNPDGNREEREAEILLDAATLREIPMETSE